MRKPQTQRALISLTAADREKLADWVRKEEYDTVLERVNKPRPEGFGLNISLSPLRTFHAKVGLLDLINAQRPPEKKISLADFELLVCRNVYLLTSEENKTLAEAHQSVLNTSADLASVSDSTPTQLATLQRVIDFPERVAIRAAKEQRAEAQEERAQAKERRNEQMHEHRIALDLRNESHRKERDEHQKRIDERNTKVREETLAFQRQKEATRAAAPKNSSLITHDSSLSSQSDELGPFARNREEVSERVRKQLGIEKEEWDRRRAANRARYEEKYGAAAKADAAEADKPSVGTLNLTDFLRDLTAESQNEASAADHNALPKPITEISELKTQN